LEFESTIIIVHFQDTDQQKANTVNIFTLKDPLNS